MLKIHIKNKQYRTFLKYAMTTCDTFSLVYEKDNINNKNYILQEFYFSILEYMLLKRKIVKHPDTGTIFCNSDIIYYECNKFTCDILQIADGIFDWNGNNLPEELCFYRNNKKWFTCICHENLLFISDENNDDIKFLEQNHINFYY